VTEQPSSKADNTSDAVIDPNNAFSTDLRSEHWRHLWKPLPLALDPGACFGTPNIVPHRLGVEAKVSLNTPSSLHLPRRLLRTKPWRSNGAPKRTIPRMRWLTLAMPSQWTWDRNIKCSYRGYDANWMLCWSNWSSSYQVVAGGPEMGGRS